MPTNWRALWSQPHPWIMRVFCNRGCTLRNRLGRLHYGMLDAPCDCSLQCRQRQALPQRREGRGICRGGRGLAGGLQEQSTHVQAAGRASLCSRHPLRCPAGAAGVDISEDKRCDEAQTRSPMRSSGGKAEPVRYSQQKYVCLHDTTERSHSHLGDAVFTDTASVLTGWRLCCGRNRLQEAGSAAPLPARMSCMATAASAAVVWRQSAWPAALAERLAVASACFWARRRECWRRGLAVSARRTGRERRQWPRAGCLLSELARCGTRTAYL